VVRNPGVHSRRMGVVTRDASQTTRWLTATVGQLDAKAQPCFAYAELVLLTTSTQVSFVKPVILVLDAAQLSLSAYDEWELGPTANLPTPQVAPRH